MFLTRIAVHGLRAAGPEPLELARTTALPPGAAGGAMADALVLAFAAMDPTATAERLDALDLVEATCTTDADGDGMVARVDGLRPDAVDALVAPDAVRQLKVHVELRPDPPMFGALRHLAARDPRLVSGLAGDATLSLTVGWAFDPDLAGASVDLLKLAVGDVVIGLAGADRPAWVGELTARLRQRVGRVGWREPADAVAARILEAWLSPDPKRRAAARRALDATGEPPFGYGRLELVRAHGRLTAAFGPDLARARHLGVAAVEALRLVEAVHVHAPDVLIVEAAGAAQADATAVRAWLDDHIHGESATLEQVLHLGGRS